MVETIVQKLVAYKVGNKTFDNKEEAEAYEAQFSLASLIGTGPFTDVDEGLEWVLANAQSLVAALRPKVVKAPTTRHYRSKQEIAAAKMAAAQKAMDAANREAKIAA